MRLKKFASPPPAALDVGYCGVSRALAAQSCWIVVDKNEKPFRTPLNQKYLYGKKACIWKGRNAFAFEIVTLPNRIVYEICEPNLLFFLRNIAVKHASSKPAERSTVFLCVFFFYLSSHLFFFLLLRNKQPLSQRELQSVTSQPRGYKWGILPSAAGSFFFCLFLPKLRLCQREDLRLDKEAPDGRGGLLSTIRFPACFCWKLSNPR